MDLYQLGQCGWEALEIMKHLVRQRARPKGSMVEGYMVYQTMVYISEYIPKFASKIHVDRI